MDFLYLTISIVAGVTGTLALEATAQLVQLLPGLVVVAGFCIAFYCLTLVLETLPIGITYVVWSGLGIVLVTVIGMLLYGEVPDLTAMIGMGLNILGMVIIHVFSGSVAWTSRRQ